MEVSSTVESPSPLRIVCFASVFPVVLHGTVVSCVCYGTVVACVCCTGGLYVLWNCACGGLCLLYGTCGLCA